MPWADTTRLLLLSTLYIWSKQNMCCKLFRMGRVVHTPVKSVCFSLLFIIKRKILRYDGRAICGHFSSPVAVSFSVLYFRLLSDGILRMPNVMSGASTHTHTVASPRRQTALQPARHICDGNRNTVCSTFILFGTRELSEKLLLFIASFNSVYNSTYADVCCWTHVINVQKYTNAN